MAEASSSEPVLVYDRVSANRRATRRLLTLFTLLILPFVAGLIPLLAPVIYFGVMGAAPSSTGVSASCLSERTEEALELAKEAIELARRFGERGNEAKALLLLAIAVVMDERSLDHIHGAWSPSEPASSRLRTTAHPKRFRSLLTSSFRRSCWRRSI